MQASSHNRHTRTSAHWPTGPSPAVGLPSRAVTPRPWWFHWAVNVGFALVAGLPFILTDKDRGWIVLTAVPVGFLMIPVTRRWERNRGATRPPS